MRKSYFVNLEKGEDIMDKLGIVIIGYKNVDGIERLLSSLDKVDFEEERDITLIFSIDYSGDNSVNKVANEYYWKYGQKHIIAHQENLGLRKHILSCGNYMEEFDLDAIAVFEDDIYVAPEMYKYMKRAIAFYKNDSKIAGISFYKHEVNSNARHPFDDYYDGGDTFFIQYAVSWGQIWMREQWRLFKKWLEFEEWKKMDDRKIPSNVRKWENSWLKYHIMYCIDKDLYFAYPRVALSTNFTDVGTHNNTKITSMQVKLCTRKESDWIFNRLDQTLAVYDAFFESKIIANKLGLDNLEVDLYGVKEYQDDTRYVLTRKHLPKQIVRSWGLDLRPIEANIYMDIPGKDIFLYDLSSECRKNFCYKQKLRCFEYDLKGVYLLRLENVSYCVLRLFEIAKIKINKLKKKIRKKKK